MTATPAATEQRETTFCPQPEERLAPVEKAEKQRPLNETDYRSQQGPKLTYLWCHDDEALVGQTLYLGGEVGSDGKIYYIPGHAPRVLQLDPDTDMLQQIGPELPGKFKWLRGVPVGDCIYALPCHADSVLRIHVPTGEITQMEIPYEEFFGQDQPAKARQQRVQEWKYHGGNQSPVDGAIYAIPQSATHVLRVDPVTVSLLQRNPVASPSSPSHLCSSTHGYSHFVSGI
jgi:hypothetical protein